MRYKIGDLSSVVGMPVHAIRFYEKYGIVTPERGEGNFRYYGELDIYRLLFAKHYRGLGFSLEETAHLVHHSTRQDQRQAYHERIAGNRREIQRLLQLEERLQKQLQEMDFADETIQQVRQVELPGYYWLFSHSEKRDVGAGPIDIRLTDHIMRNMHKLHFFSLIQAGDLLGKDALHYSWGIAFEESQRDIVPPGDLDKLRYLSPGPYLAHTTMVNEDCVVSREMFRPQLEQAGSVGSIPGDTAIAALQAGEFIGPGRTKTPVICYLPIKPNKSR